MAKQFQLNNKRVDKSIQNFLQEKRATQQHEKQLRRLEISKASTIKDIDSEMEQLKDKLTMYGQGMTRLSSYFNKEKTDINKNTIWFPLERSPSDWDPRPCWLGKAAVNAGRCLYFPCRRHTSYHFMFREFPQWVLDRAEESVRRSRHGHLEQDNTPTAKEEHDGSTCIASLTDISDTSARGTADRSVFRKPWLQKPDTHLPKIDFPVGMTTQEKKLKITIEKKRLRNEMENKPAERCVNYGQPTPIRRLQRPVRPVVRRMDIKG
ncbi:uncharacterized protein LOC128207523 [Mya arenaria]|uniref:uncharacterized protein LOC128207523 n=1 Tax=Mya arenaria TaxID=6604 RepID=UPI0022E7B2E0|nr:uncharacterized protein LOC128207523 [Mya arenaria]